MKSTKELARELGILRQRSAAKFSAAENDRKRAKNSNQIFSFLIIIDFESTCWEREKHRTQEIIEFPAVLLNVETGEIQSEFHQYVQPQENPILSDFCKQLTGITQDQVDDSAPLFICLRQYSKWLKELSASMMITFDSLAGASKPTAFVTWSDWDLGVCLQYECRRKQLRKPIELNSWIDLRATYRRHYQRRPQGLNGALQELGISFAGREHSGLDDARNTARLAWKMICDGCVMEITKTQVDTGIGRTVIQRPYSVTTVNLNKNAQPEQPAAISDQQKPKSAQPNIDKSTCNANQCALDLNRSAINSNQSAHSLDQHTINIEAEVNVWGSDDIADDEILQYLNAISPSNKSSSVAVVQYIRESSLNSCPFNGTPLKIDIQEKAARTPNGRKKSQAFRDLTNTPRSNLSPRSVSSPAPKRCKVTMAPGVKSQQFTGLKRCSPIPPAESLKMHNVLVKPKTSPALCERLSVARPLGYDKPSYIPVASASSLNLVSNDLGHIHQSSPGLSAMQTKGLVKGAGALVASSRSHQCHHQAPTDEKFTSILASENSVEQENEKGCTRNIVSSVKCVQPIVITPNSRLNHTPSAIGRNGASCSSKSHSTLFSGSNHTPCGPSAPVTMNTSMKRTPPMCDCGCRAKRKYVQSPGPNMGRAFFCCGGRRQSFAVGGCKFFKWETSITPLSSGGGQTPGGFKAPRWNSPIVQPNFDTPVLTRPLNRTNCDRNVN